MNIKSSNFDKKPRNLKKIKYIVIHYTGMQSEVEAIKRLTNPKSKVSCHYFINKKGKVKKLISERFVAWHAGRSNWKNLNSLNRFSIGIELTNPGHAHKYKKFPAIQISSLIKVLKYLMKKYNVPKKNILGHSDISPLRKKDPGEKFPWQKLAKSNICIWHNLDKKYISEKRKNKISIQEKIDFFKFLKKIGYQSKFKVKKSLYEKKLIHAFQRRYRPELISAKVDEECLIIAKNIGFLAK